MKSKKPIKTFTQLQDWYWECGLSMLEVNIIARIASWQRANKEFYESAQKTSELFRVSYSSVKRAYKELLAKGIIKKNGKHKRMWKYQVNEYKLQTVHREQLLLRNSSPRTDIQVTVNHYNTTKTSTKTSFKEEDDFLESSPSKDTSNPSDLDIKMFARNLDK
tara:strand:+ start:373 stop:861 length:489 start_codon:yes stop_codon:yes gene_type:complete